jgi:small-conductance mechanosensitive channel
VATLTRLADAYREDLGQLEAQRFLAARLHDALEERSVRLRVLDRLEGLREVGSTVWRYELWSSEDRPITVAKVFSALAVFVVGFLLARRAAQALGRRVFSRLRRDEGAVHAFESLAFYVLLVLVFLTALRVVNIPLTAFAVLGGALAIGFGFGSQNVVNNFISGVILLAERPIKLGDLVEVGDVYGLVEQIGLRSTRVRTGDNVHIILPNSSILESQVVNWTHNDPEVRVNVTVGIAYGSPTREAERRIRQVLIDHPKVHATPEPIILFRDFGNDALIFEARFWVTMRTLMDRLRIESEVRFGIDDAFREAGITIAFPQRDVHLDTLRPLDVRVVGPRHDREELS